MNKKIIIVLVLLIVLYLLSILINNNFNLNNLFNKNVNNTSLESKEKIDTNNRIDINYEIIEKEISENQAVPDVVVDSNKDEVSVYEDKGYCYKDSQDKIYVKVDLFFDKTVGKIIQKNEYVELKNKFDKSCDELSNVVFDNPEYAKGRYFKCSDYLNSKKNCNLK